MQRRKVSRLSSAQAAAMVADLVACRLEGVESDEMLEGFKIRMTRVYGRGPTEGELNLYRNEFGKLVGGILRRGEKARNKEETGHEKPGSKMEDHTSKK